MNRRTVVIGFIPRHANAALLVMAARPSINEQVFDCISERK